MFKQSIGIVLPGNYYLIMLKWDIDIKNTGKKSNTNNSEFKTPN